MTYNWDDFRDNSVFKVEWSNDVKGSRNTRRARIFESSTDNYGKSVLLAFLILSLIILLGSVAFVSTEVMRSGPGHVVDNSDGMEGFDPIQTSLSTEFPSSSISPAPSIVPSLRPSYSPLILSSTVSSTSSSSLPSVESTVFLKAPPAPQYCIDQMGLFVNHEGVNATCGWLQSEGSYIHKLNCGRTELGRACLLECSNYYNCTIQEVIVSNETTVLPSSSPTEALLLPSSITITASEDTSIKQSIPDANLGTASWIKIDNDSGVFHALLKFNISHHDQSGKLQSASLRLKAASDCPSGGYIERTHHPNWDENSVSWATAPGGDGTVVARLESIKKGYWYSVDILKAFSHGHNVLSLRMFPVSTKECMFESKENPSGSAPELHLVYAKS